jgi:antitoxin ParD1/3/4
MKVHLTPELEQLVQSKVKSGRYNSASEVLREALRLLEQRDAPLRNKVITRRVLKDIRSGFELLGNEPGAGHVREDLTSRPVKFFQIIRVLHGMRDAEKIIK